MVDPVVACRCRGNTVAMLEVTLSCSGQLMASRSCVTWLVRARTRLVYTPRRIICVHHTVGMYVRACGAIVRLCVVREAVKTLWSFLVCLFSVVCRCFRCAQ